MRIRVSGPGHGEKASGPDHGDRDAAYGGGEPIVRDSALQFSAVPGLCAAAAVPP